MQQFCPFSKILEVGQHLWDCRDFLAKQAYPTKHRLNNGIVFSKRESWASAKNANLFVYIPRKMKGLREIKDAHTGFSEPQDHELFTKARLTPHSHLHGGAYNVRHLCFKLEGYELCVVSAVFSPNQKLLTAAIYISG